MLPAKILKDFSATGENLSSKLLISIVYFRVADQIDALGSRSNQTRTHRRNYFIIAITEHQTTRGELYNWRAAKLAGLLKHRRESKLITASARINKFYLKQLIKLKNKLSWQIYPTL